MRRRDLIKLLPAALLAGCGVLAPPTPTPEPVEISFAYQYKALDAYYQRLREEFQAANPRWKVSLSQGNIYNRLFGGDQADVTEVEQLPIAILADRQVIRPLDPLVQEAEGFDLQAFYPGTLESLRWQGQLWGLPAGVDPSVLFYNKDIFDAKSLPYPNNEWTWDDLLEAALELAEPDADPSLWGLVSDQQRNDYVGLIYQNGGTLFDSLVDPKGVTLTAPETIEAVEWYASLALAHRVMPKPQDISGEGGMRTVVVSKRAAMWYGSLSERAGKAWEVPWRFNWGVVAPPGRRQRVSLLAVRAYAVGQRSARPGPAFEWAKYLALHPDEALDVPALKEAAQAETLFASEPAEVAAAARHALLEGRALPPVPWLLDLSRQLDGVIRDIFYSEKSVEDALTEAQEGTNSAIARQQGEE